jgi:hypothetical protein
VLSLARALAEHPRLDALSITNILPSRPMTGGSSRARANSRGYRLALEMLPGNDPGCTNYRDAFRGGELEAQPA